MARKEPDTTHRSDEGPTTRGEDVADVLAGLLVLGFALVAGWLYLVILFITIPAAMSTAPSGFLLDYPFGDLPGVDGPVLNPEFTLLVIAATAGAAGALIHSVKKMSIHIGVRSFDWRWTPWTLTHPLRGALIGVVLYGAFRAGLVVVDGTAPPSHPFAVLALCGVGGLTADTTAGWLSEKFGHWLKVEDPSAKGKPRSHELKVQGAEAGETPPSERAAPRNGKQS